MLQGVAHPPEALGLLGEAYIDALLLRPHDPPETTIESGWSELEILAAAHGVSTFPIPARLRQARHRCSTYLEMAASAEGLPVDRLTAPRSAMTLSGLARLAQRDGCCEAERQLLDRAASIAGAIDEPVPAYGNGTWSPWFDERRQELVARAAAAGERCPS